MAEIKSTLDLVMEKTKHLKLTEEEKAEMQLQDFLKKVPFYLDRILNSVLTPEQLLDETNSLPQELTGRARREIAGQVSQALDLTGKSDTLISVLEMLVEPDWSEILAEVKHCRDKYRQAREGVGQKVEARLLDEFSALGIRGSAVVAKLDGNPVWEAEDQELRQTWEYGLKALRETLTGSR